MMKHKRVEIRISEELYWKLEEERVKARCEDLSGIIERLLRKALGMKETAKLKETEELNEKTIDECISKVFPNARGEKYRDLKKVVYIMVTKGVSRREAVKIRAKEKGVDTSTVQANITRGFGIDTEELDRRLKRVINCLKGKVETFEG